MSKCVGIVLVNYNGWEDTLVCLNSIIEQDYSNYHIVIVDNKSTDDSVKHIVNWIYQKNHNKLNEFNNDLSFEIDNQIIYNLKYNKRNSIILIRAKSNRGFASGNNIGISIIKKKFDCNYIWFLNNDTYIEKKSLVSLVRRMEEEKSQKRKIGILGSKIINYNTTDIIQSVGFKYNKYFSIAKPIGKNQKDIGQFDIEHIDADYIMGASMFVDVDFIKEVGGMCEEYFLFFEELDWILRGEKIGWKFGYEFNSKVFHKQGGTTGLNSTSRNEFMDYFQIKNRLLFTYKYYPLCLITLYPALIVSLFKRILNKEYTAAWNIIKLIFSFK